jgi:hypothetical protein
MRRTATFVRGHGATKCVRETRSDNRRPTHNPEIARAVSTAGHITMHSAHGKWRTMATPSGPRPLPATTKPARV